MSDNDSIKTPLIDNLRAAPVDLRCEWAFQWAEDGSTITIKDGLPGIIAHMFNELCVALTTDVEANITPQETRVK